MNITLAQLNPVIGDIEGNAALAIAAMDRCRSEKPDLVVLPELFLTGYPPLDLLERPWFIDRVQAAIDELARKSARFPGTGMIFGAPTRAGNKPGKRLHNSAVLVCDGRVVATVHKSLLPTYDVFDERRYFDPAADIRPVPFKGESLGVSVCEDAWNDTDLWPRGSLYDLDPIDLMARRGATVMINISASPFFMGKEEIRFHLIRNHVRRHRLPFFFVNQVGGNDELVFDGRSFALDRDGEPLAVCRPFREDTRTADAGATGVPGLFAPPEPIESAYEALVLGTRDYMGKCGFRKAVIGLSGGIDSALVCCIARDAVGRESVLGITMPSPISSPGSVEDSRRLAANLGIAFQVIPIASIRDAYLETMKEPFAGRPEDVTEENIQARIRGNILMAVSNKFGHLVLSTGNKSEMAVGFCTLYGDMSGGLAVLSDVPKTLVYDLARFLNRNGALIPEAIIAKPPSAELRPGQLDEDSLPPYPVLDAILHRYIEDLISPQEIVAAGFDPGTVAWVVRAVEKSEYKRKQAAPCLKITTKAFGVGRRMPIAAKASP
jgi:NAD+ synthase (glutamine-hydrolysing)